MRELFAAHKVDLLLAIGAVTLSTATNYLIVYMPTYAVKSLGLPQSIGFLAAVVAALPALARRMELMFPTESARMMGLPFS